MKSESPSQMQEEGHRREGESKTRREVMVPCIRWTSQHRCDGDVGR